MLLVASVQAARAPGGSQASSSWSTCWHSRARRRLASRVVGGREVTRAFSRDVLGADLPIIRLHDLRHTHATLALAAGVHPKVVQERLGHANIAITLDVYSHAVPALEEQAAATVARLVFGP
jgi:integrase